MVDIQFDINRVIRYSKNKNSLAIKLKQPLDGEDHLILQCNDRLNIIVYISHLGISVENKDEFSILNNSKPIWFKFSELAVERTILKKQNSSNARMCSFVRFWSLEKQEWEDRCLILDENILYIFKDQDQMPSLSINLTPDLQVEEVNEYGQQNIWSITAAYNLPTLKFMARNRD